MATKKPRTVLFRRRREQKTDYPNRLRLLLSKKIRLVVRITNHKIIAQLIGFDIKGDKVLVAVDSTTLKTMGWNYSYKNYPAAYLTGLLLGKTGAKKGCHEAILDVGFKSPLKKSKIYAFLKGVLDGGINVPHGEADIFPDEDRIAGRHISAYAAALKGKKEYEERFAQYLKDNHAPEKISEAFKAVKQKIMG